MTKETGGSAYPTHFIETENGMPYLKTVELGVSIRDYFAAKSLSGLISAHTGIIGHGGRIDPQEVAQYSYELADAMIEARKS